MKNTAKQLSIILLGVLLLALAVVPASAQGSPVTASVDRTSLSTDEMLTLRDHQRSYDMNEGLAAFREKRKPAWVKGS